MIMAIEREVGGRAAGGLWRRIPAVSLLCMLAALAGCNSNEGKLTSADADTGGLWSIRVSSPAFKSGKMIPRKYTADGANISPPLHWEGVPPETKELALVMQDPDTSGNNPVTHWLVYGIAPQVTGLQEDADSSGELTQGENSFGNVGYSGPTPPPGKPHRYFFQVYALDEPLKVPGGAIQASLMESLRGHVLSKGQLVGIYQRARK